MRGPVINQGGNPNRDGEVTAYVSEELAPKNGKPKSWYNPTHAVIFVNGMDNSASDHRESAEALSLMLGCRVIGVFNASQGKMLDLVQCITDKLTLTNYHFNPVGAARGGPLYGGMSDFNGMKRSVDTLFDQARARNPGLEKDSFVARVLEDNPAAVALYKLLLGTPNPMLGKPIHAHSQGNLITSNALTAVGLARGYGALNNLEVNSYGSPARNWPPGIRRTNNAFSLDPVGWLDLTMDLTSSKVGFKAAHGFVEYQAHDGEFVVNRFRTGGMGMTMNMDEDGLADFCVGLGRNTDRLRSIFDRLEKAHFSDSDDVALLYVNKKTDADLAELARIDGSFIDQLIRLLEAGWTSRSESAAIERLKRARQGQARS